MSREFHRSLCTGCQIREDDLSKMSELAHLRASWRNFFRRQRNSNRSCSLCKKRYEDLVFSWVIYGAQWALCKTRLMSCRSPKAPPIPVIAHQLGFLSTCLSVYIKYFSVCLCTKSSISSRLKLKHSILPSLTSLLEKNCKWFRWSLVTFLLLSPHIYGCRYASPHNQEIASRLVDELSRELTGQPTTIIQSKCI